jgi:hypothetical protein
MSDAGVRNIYVKCRYFDKAFPKPRVHEFLTHLYLQSQAVGKMGRHNPPTLIIILPSIQPISKYQGNKYKKRGPFAVATLVSVPFEG